MIIWIVLFVLCAGWLHAQRAFKVTPIVGLNSTRMNLHEAYTFSKFTKGGTFFLAGVETEFRLTPKAKRLDLSAVLGCTYLANGFNYIGEFSFADISYSYEKMELKMKYIQFPLELKLNWQPFPLVENFQLFFGGGISFNVLQNAHLKEQAIYSFYSSDVMNPPTPTDYYQDEADVTNLARKQSYFSRFELGVRYKRAQISCRISRALQDMYFAGLEDSWAVPVDRSVYLGGHELNGEIFEKYVEVVFGYRVF